MLLLICWARAAAAHLMPIPIAFWGGFDSTAAECQRVVGAVAARCGLTAWSARNACMTAQAGGGQCDVGAADTAVGQAHQDALDTADGVCAGADLTALNFNLSLDVNLDIDTFCNELENAAVSAVYFPALRANRLQPVDTSTQACMRVTGRTTTTLLAFAFRTIRRTLDRIACEHLTPTQKLDRLAQAAASIAHAEVVLGTRLASMCPAFSSLYHRDAGAFLTAIGARYMCLAGSTYVQDAVLCPAAVCGNGIREGTEQCDDGNLVAGDGCSPSCTVEP